jgi:adenylate cyclase
MNDSEAKSPLPITAELIAEFGESKRFTLKIDEPCHIGRTAQNQIQLSSDQVSRHHALIRADKASGFLIYDLGSRNGTLVNGRRITVPTELRSDDLISIGGFDLRFVQQEASPEPESGSLISGETVVNVSLREITIIVADIRGYTDLCRQIGEVRIAEILQSFNTSAGAMLETMVAWSVKYIGDAVMAIWVHRAPRMASVLAGLRAIAALQEIAMGLQSRFDLKDPVRIGAALNIGFASIGNMGSNSAADYTALGDSVNKAFRLESATRALDADIALSTEVYEMLQRITNLEGLATPHEVQLKGYAESSVVYVMTRQNLQQALPLIALAANG